MRQGFAVETGSLKLSVHQMTLSRILYESNSVKEQRQNSTKRQKESNKQDILRMEIVHYQSKVIWTSKQHSSLDDTKHCWSNVDQMFQIILPHCWSIISSFLRRAETTDPLSVLRHPRPRQFKSCSKRIQPSLLSFSSVFSIFILLIFTCLVAAGQPLDNLPNQIALTIGFTRSSYSPVYE